jgi:hypothetical protein
MKHYLVNIEEQYEGFEWHSHCIIDANNKAEIYYMKENDLSYYGHEGIGSEIYVRNVQELTDVEYNVLKGLGF